MKIRYIDTFSYKTAHLQINASLLVMLSKIGNEVIYYAGKSSMAEVYSLLAKSNVEVLNVQANSIFVCGGNNRLSLLMRYLISAFMNLILLVRSHKKDVIIYNFNNLFSLRLINAVNGIIKRKVLICCHGELELLSDAVNEGGGLAKCLRYLARDFFLKPRKIQNNVYFMVLGDVILKNLRSYLTKEQLKKFISVDHPYIFIKQTQDTNKTKWAEGLHIGTVGAFSQIKGADLFVKIVSEVKNPSVHFSITGRIFYPMVLLQQLGVDTAIDADKKALSQKIYNERISRLDYILFLYSPNSYRITASGAVMDAINLKKPIIALKNDYFCYMFEKYGSFGCLFENIEDMTAFLSNQIQKESLQIYNFEKIQDLMSPQYIARNLHCELKRIGFIL